jgi:3'-phosphoadenosine 5'-phosphosulfate sulfotransferase (PAPS reductase)/FAD synthetase
MISVGRIQEFKESVDGNKSRPCITCSIAQKMIYNIRLTAKTRSSQRLFLGVRSSERENRISYPKDSAGPEKKKQKDIILCALCVSAVNPLLNGLFVNKGYRENLRKKRLP